jgi:hypothetical protein
LEQAVPYRIQRSEHDGATVFLLSGELDGQHAAQLEELLAGEPPGRNLGPGPDGFRVIASNSDGVWNSAEAALSFTIVPAPWETR